MPTSTLHVEMSTHHSGLGIRLDGSCTTDQAAVQLRRVIEQTLMGRLATAIWIDCQQLERISYHAQQVMLQVEQRAQAQQCTLYWCGFRPLVIQQLTDTGLYLLLRHLPATS